MPQNNYPKLREYVIEVLQKAGRPLTSVQIAALIPEAVEVVELHLIEFLSDDVVPIGDALWDLRSRQIRPSSNSAVDNKPSFVPDLKPPKRSDPIETRTNGPQNNNPRLVEDIIEVLEKAGRPLTSVQIAALIPESVEMVELHLIEFLGDAVVPIEDALWDLKSRQSLPSSNVSDSSKLSFAPDLIPPKRGDSPETLRRLEALANRPATPPDTPKTPASIPFLCSKCSQLLQAPASKSGGRATCPKCNSKSIVPPSYKPGGGPDRFVTAMPAEVSQNYVQTRPPSSSGTPSNPPQVNPQRSNPSRAPIAPKQKSWFQWMFGAEPKAQAKATRKAETTVANISQVLDKLEQHRLGVEQNLRDSVEQLRESEANELMQATSLDSIGGLTSGHGVQSLQAAGVNSLYQVANWSEDHFRQIDGIGAKKSERLVSVVRQVTGSILNRAFRIPLPDDISEKHRPLLESAYATRRLVDIPEDACNTLDNRRAIIVALLDKKRRIGSFFNRLFRRSTAEKELEDVAKDLENNADLPDTASAFQTIDEVLPSLFPPRDLDVLVDDYRKNFADYSAILERESEVEVVTASVVKRGRQGGLPSQIVDAVESVQLSVDGLDVNLRAYQEFGIKYLIHQRRTVLGDEMGLGKTIQAMGAAVHAKETEGAGAFLIVAPASILGNWQREIESRTSIQCRMLHGAQRDFNLRQWKLTGGFGLTSYATLKSLHEINIARCDLLIVDEAHYAKNPGAMRSRSVAQIAANAQRVVLMTGTPLENRVEEFINLIRICDRDMATQVGKGLSFVSESDAQNFEKRVAPVYLRRNQTDVLTELPEVVENLEWVDMTPADWNRYEASLADRHIMGLRRAANGSDLTSSKMRRLKELVDQYRYENRKVVIFSFFKSTLDLAGEIAGTFQRIDGGVPAAQRMRIVDDFNNSAHWQALVSQIDAGGVGLNLQGASVVILVEPQFKPTTEWQAIKRVHRMGQTQRVLVHRLLASDTVDERMYDLIGKKALIFDDYARESAVKDASSSAADGADAKMKQRILDMELDRSRRRTAGVS